jgi:Phospholipid methyltransferase
VVLGEAGRMLTVGFVPRGTSGCKTGAGQVATRLNTNGVCSRVRSPLYRANCVMCLGVVLFTQSLVLTVIFVLVLLACDERIIAAEEALLSDKSVIRQEHASVYRACVALFLIEIGLDPVDGGPPDQAPVWAMGVLTLIEVIVLYCKKRSSLLTVAGR